MKNTGRINPITKKPIFRMEEDDINWRYVQFDELSLSEQGDILSFLGLTFLNSVVKPSVIKRYNYYRDKNCLENGTLTF